MEKYGQFPTKVYSNFVQLGLLGGEIKVRGGDGDDDDEGDDDGDGAEFVPAKLWVVGGDDSHDTGLINYGQRQPQRNATQHNAGASASWKRWTRM